MTFAFEIISAHEIHRDQSEYYRHWTILIGTLRSGSIRLGDRIVLPSVDDKLLVATVLAFELSTATFLEVQKVLMTPEPPDPEDQPSFLRRRRRLWLGQSPQQEVQATERTQPFVIVTWAPAHTEADIQVGSVATGCSEEIYKSVIVEILQRDPECILDCINCAKSLSKIPEAIPYLRQLVVHPNIKLVSCAIGVLSRESAYPKFY